MTKSADDEIGIGRLPEEFTDYFRISDEFARDADLPPRATKVGLFVFSHREGFRLTQKQIAKRLKMNIGTVRAALGDLREANYLRSWIVRDRNGHIVGTRYVVHDHRVPDDVWDRYLTSLNTKSESREPNDEGLGSDFEHTDSEHWKSEPHKGDQFNQGNQGDQGPFSSTPADADPDQATPPTELRADVEQLCARLRDHVIANGGKPPTITDTWRRDARLLLDRDGRRLDHALNLIDWCQNDDFWAGNVLSIGKFRKQYDQLRLKATAEWRRKREKRRESPTTAAVNATQAAWEAYDQQHSAVNEHALAGGRA